MTDLAKHTKRCDPSRHTKNAVAQLPSSSVSLLVRLDI